jgi:dihydroorotase
MIRGAVGHGIDVTTESYPYTASATRIESALFDPWEDRTDAEYAQLQWPPTGERLDSESFRRYRNEGGWIIIHGRSEETSEWIVAQPDVMVASDGAPYFQEAVHPRGAGTFAKVLGYYVRERNALSLMDALAKMTLMPAERLSGVAPQMQKKGRIQVGADADITVFDPATIIDRATYVKADLPSGGIPYVLVGGTFVVYDGESVDGVYPGTAILRGQ